MSQDQQQQLILLQEIASRSEQLEVWEHKALESLQLRWNERLYKSVLDNILARTDFRALLSNPFALPTTQLELNGELKLGEIIGAPGIEFRLPIDKLAMHICAAGSSGSGKSNFAMSLIQKATLSGVKSIRIVDPKADEYLRLATVCNDFLVLKWHELRFNPLTPPPNVPQNEWLQTFVGHMSQAFNFWQGAEGLLLRHLNLLRDNSTNVTIPNLLKSVHTSKSVFGSKDIMIKSTVVSRLQMLLDLFGKTITSDSDMLQILTKRRSIISMSGIMAESESWLTEFLLLWEFMYRVYNPSKRELTLHVYDECQHRLFSSEKEKAAQRIGSSLISQLVDEARALNIGICSLSQEPSTLIKAVVNNSWLKLTFHLGSGGEIRVMKEAMGLNKEEAEMLHYMETGEAIVRMAGGYMDAIPVKCDEFISSNDTNWVEFWQHQEEMKAKLYQESNIITDSQSKNTITFIKPKPTQYTNTNSEKRGDNNSQQEASDSTNQNIVQEEAQSQKAKCRKQSKAKPIDGVKPLLNVWLNLEKPFLTQGEIFSRAGITSGSKLSKLKKICISNCLIIEHKLQVGKTYVSVWEPTIKAFELVQIKKPQHKSKGGYLHQFIAFRIKQWGLLEGYSVELETMLSNGKAVDLVLRKTGEIIFVEIAVSSPLEKELENYVKDFGTQVKPDRLIAAVVNKKARVAIEKLIKDDSRLDCIRDKIEVRLAGDYLKM